MLRITDDEVWLYYWHYINCKEKISRKYTSINKIDYNKLYRFASRYNYLKKNNVVYEQHIYLHKKYISSGMTPKRFCSENKISVNELSRIGTHLEYLATVERLKKERDISIKPEPSRASIPKSKEMSFFNIPSSKNEITPIDNTNVNKPEILNVRNDIEIVISKGVKVILSPSIDAQTIIKIIELLKEI